MKAVALLSLILLSGCTVLPKVVRVGNTSLPEAKNSRIFVVSHGWHTGIIVSADKLDAVLPELAMRFSKKKYYEIGWGDAGFYRSEKITTYLTLKAVFWLNSTVVHVVAFNESPIAYFQESEVLPVTISERGYESLLAYLDSSFGRTKDGHIQKLGVGRYGDSEFYEGTGKYFLFNTCNTWTARGLSSSGFFPKNAFKLTAGGVMNATKEDSRGSMRILH